MKATAVWANETYIDNVYHMFLLRQILALEVLCSHSTKFVSTNGLLDFSITPAAFHWSRRFECPWSIINSELHKDCTCIDLGSTSAVLKYYLAKRCKLVVAQDIDQIPMDLIPVTHLFQSYDNISLEVSDIAELEPDQYDRSFCISTLEHTKNPFECFTKCWQVVKKNGVALISVDVSDRVTGNKDASIDMDIARQMCNSVGIDLPPQLPPDTVATFDGFSSKCLCIKVKK